MDKRILFLDLDGTLLDDQKQIPEENKQALHKAVELGHQVVIATGRALSSAQELMKRLEFDRAGFYCIAYNGGILYDCGKRQVLSQHTLPLEIMLHIAGEAQKRGLFCQTYQGPDILALKDCPELQYYVKKTGMSYRITDDFRHELQGDPHKALIVNLQGRQVLERTLPDLISRGYSSLTINEDGTIEVQDEQGGRAIQRFSGFPKRDGWPELVRVLEGEGYAASEDGHGITMTW